jgi:hypothetical protein
MWHAKYSDQYSCISQGIFSPEASELEGALCSYLSIQSLCLPDFRGRRLGGRGGDPFQPRGRILLSPQCGILAGLRCRRALPPERKSEQRSLSAFGFVLWNVLLPTLSGPITRGFAECPIKGLNSPIPRNFRLTAISPVEILQHRFTVYLLYTFPCTVEDDRAFRVPVLYFCS